MASSGDWLFFQAVSAIEWIAQKMSQTYLIIRKVDCEVGAVAVSDGNHPPRHTLIPLLTAESLSDFWRSDFVRRSTSDFIGYFDGGVLLLPESFGGFSYFSKRLRNSRFSFSSLSILWESEHISSCYESMVRCISPSYSNSPRRISVISLTGCFTDVKIVILFESAK